MIDFAWQSFFINTKVNVTFRYKKKKMEISFFFFLNIASITKCDTALITKSENQLCSTKNTASTRKLKHAILYRSYKKKKERERENIETFSSFTFSIHGRAFMNKKKTLTNNYAKTLCIKVMNVGRDIIHWIIKIMVLVFFCHDSWISREILTTSDVMRFIMKSSWKTIWHF